MKATSPVRLQDDLMRAAMLVGEQEHRSAAEQIEYWATLGRKIAGFVSPMELLEVASGLAQVTVERAYGQPVDPDAVFASVEAKRQSGELARAVTSSPISYQASTTHPGYLDQIDENGHRTVGKFHSGIFIPITDNNE